MSHFDMKTIITLLLVLPTTPFLLYYHISFIHRFFYANLVSSFCLFHLELLQFHFPSLYVII